MAVAAVLVAVTVVRATNYRYGAYRIETGGFFNTYDAVVIDGSHIWAASDSGLIEYDGNTWTARALADLDGSSGYLTGVDARDGGVWVTGLDCRLGTLDGDALTLTRYPGGCSLYDVGAVSRNSAVAVGQTADNQGLLIWRDSTDAQQQVIAELPPTFAGGV